MSTPKYVANGTYGCVFKPAVSCKGKPQVSGDVVAKLFRDPYQAHEEVSMNVNVVNKIDPNHKFTVRMHQHCAIENKEYKSELYKCNNWSDSEKTMPYIKQLVYENGGMELRVAASSIPFQELFSRFQNIFEGLKALEKSGYVHLDIKPTNIVFNPSTRKMSLIDFGLATYKGHVYSDRSILSYEYPYFPPEFQVVGSNGANETFPVVDYSFYYKNIRSALHTNKLGKVPSELVHDTQSLFLWKALTNDTRDFQVLVEYLKSLRLDPTKTLASKVQAHVHLVDVYMLGATLLETFAIAFKSGQANITSSNADFYKKVLYLIYDMTYIDPRKRLSPTHACARFLMVANMVKHVPSTPVINITPPPTKRVDNKPSSKHDVNPIEKEKPKPKQKSKPKQNFDKAEICKKFKSNPRVNPITNRIIKHGGPKYKELVKLCS